MDAFVPTAAPRQAPLSTSLFLLLLGITVFLATWGCIALSRHAGHISTIWVGNAIVLAALLKHPRRLWGQIGGVALFSYVLVGMLTGDSALNSLALSSINGVEILIVALPLRWLAFDRDFSRGEVLLAFYALVIVGCGGSAFVAAVAMHFSKGLAIWAVMRVWFGPDALGLSLLVPFFLCVKPRSMLQMFSAGQRLGTVLLLGAVLAAGALCFALPQWPLAFLYMPVLILLTFKRGFAGGALGIVLALAMSFTQVLGPHVSQVLAAHSPSERIAMLQLYFAVVGFTIILAGAALEERRRLEHSLAVAARGARSAREEALLAKEVAEKASTAKSAFLANMSHELRTPLNAVLGFSEIIHGEMFGPVGDARYRNYAGLINSAGTHLLDLIGDILDMSKIEAGKLELHRERLVVASVVSECVELMAERGAAAGIEFTTDLASAPRLIDADKRAVKQILLNLLSNAIKFTPKGGSVVLQASSDGAACRFAVIDTGIGMPAAEMDRIGSPFVQLSNNSGQHPGTGLGLALVRGLAELHGGTVRIDSVEGQGTTVTVTLPIAVAPANAVAA